MRGARLRERFTFPLYDMATWFPGHMYKGIQGMQKRIGDMDCIIEVHDARIPFTGRNPIFDRHAKMRPHILVLSKVDLVDKKSVHWMQKNPDKLGATEVILADMKRQTLRTSNLLVEKMLEVIDHTDRFHRSRNESYHVLVAGIPNVGKSTLINYLRNTTLKKKGKSAKVGGIPGITKSVMERIKICEDPKIYLVDTPGVLTPRIESAEVALQLAACNTVRSEVLGEELICDYILYYLNKHGLTRYVEEYGLDEPIDNIHEVLKAIAKKYDKHLKHRVSGEYQVLPNFQFAAHKMLHDFNRGLLAEVNFNWEMMS
ncbi:MTG1 [Bugula neritina]|uniref:Mitochondrial GTPase 1 n=1 Tax=Bugula neritina TaxID=10212 RepID=A0A7J7IT43_BUGNE|nr:MTG1 [Bugula neritina]